MTFSALFVDFCCHSFLALRQTSQLLAVHFDTTVSVSGEVGVKSKTLREDAERSQTDGAISSFIFMLMPFFSSLDGEKMDLRGRKVQRRCGVRAWSLSSGVRSASYRLRRSVLLGWVVSGREARRPAAKMMERTCSMDARGRTAIGHQEVSPTDSYCAVQRTTLARCVRTFFFSPLFANARRLTFTEPPSRPKVSPEVRARGRVGGGDER